MSWGKHYIIGVSVGVMAQPTAIAVIEQESHHDKHGHGTVNELRLRHLERLSLAASYPDVAKRLRGIRDSLKEQYKGDPGLAVDVTGTGSSVVKFFRDEGLNPVQAWITAGRAQSEIEPGEWRVAKLELVGALQVELQNNTLKVASGLDLVSALKAELANFRMRTTPVSGDDIEAWREGSSDDLVFATALAVWWAQKDIPMPQSEVDRISRMINDPKNYIQVA